MNDLSELERVIEVLEIKLGNPNNIRISLERTFAVKILKFLKDKGEIKRER